MHVWCLLGAVNKQQWAPQQWWLIVVACWLIQLCVVAISGSLM